MEGDWSVQGKFIYHTSFEPCTYIHQEILNVYGDYLYERREFREAASGIVANTVSMILSQGIVL